MENKKSIKTSLIIFILFILIIFIAILIFIKVIPSHEKNSISNKNTSSMNTNMNNNVDNNVDNNITNNTNETVDNLIVLYKGLDISGVNEDIELYIDYTDENKEKYEISYYNYENGKFLGVSDGRLEQSYENCGVVENVKKLAISRNYNPVPRSYSTLNKLPDNIADLADFSNVIIHQIDLDGNGSNENIVIASYERSADDSEDGKYTNYSCVMIFDNNFNKIDDLAHSSNQFWENNGSITDKFLISPEDIEYFDINNDGKMEILLDSHIYEGVGVEIYSYENGKITGNTNKEIIVLP